jgi:ubiquinone/menaquinone biosynthesis C-methylase UbiE
MLNNIDPREAYDQWAEQYDTNQNRTRDLEGLSLREHLAGKPLGRVLEIGCGTGKNTVWLVQHAESVSSVDLSGEMLARAREKVTDPKVRFVQADINRDWHFTEGERFDLVVFSLVLEHIEDLDAIFRKLHAVLDPGGRVYIGELHPFKQYAGTKARFETEEGTKVVTCFIHHVSEFTDAAKAHGFRISRVAEYFDEPNRQGIPRILTLMFNK